MRLLSEKAFHPSLLAASAPIPSCQSPSHGATIFKARFSVSDWSDSAWFVVSKSRKHDLIFPIGAAAVGKMDGKNEVAAPFFPKRRKVYKFELA